MALLPPADTVLPPRLWADRESLRRALIRLYRLAVPLEADERPLASAGRRNTRLIGVGAAAISILAWLYFHNERVILAYQDAISHMEIARRVVDSPTTGFGQLGGVWLPLPHLLMLPFIWINALYYSGLAGSLVSMTGFVVTSVLLYKIVLNLTGRPVAALAGALVFMTNPGVLYLQSTPMTELPMFACMVGMVYGLQRWIETEDYRYLFASGIAAVLGTLTRYEVWVLLMTAVALLVFIGWRKGYGRVKTEGLTIAFLFVGALGVTGWLTWNQVIFGNALNWQNGKYAKPSLWIGQGEHAVGHWLSAVQTYWYAVTDNLGWVTVAVVAGGLLILLVRRQLTMRALPALSLLVMFPFFVLALETGQRPLHVLQLDSDLYNVRFGLLMILPAAIFAGCIAGAAPHRRTVTLLAAGIVALTGAYSVSAFTRPQTRIAVLHEPLRWQQSGSTSEAQAAAFLHRNYEGGKILAQFFGNEALLFGARISLAADVYEGSYRQWTPALASPSSHDIKWIVMHLGGNPDQVAFALQNSPELKPYRLVYVNAQYRIYRA